MLKDSCDIGIVVALPDEFRELQRQLAHRWTPLFDKDTATYYYLFTCESASGEPPYTCVAAFAGSMGPTKAALLTERLRVRWGVATVINVGIAGALDDDVHLTDVVVGSVADNYLERAKAVDSTEGDGFDFDLSGEPFRSSHALINACVNLEFANSDLFTEWRRSCALALSGLPMAERERLNNEGLIATSSLVVSGHIACGPSVGASVAFKRWLKRRDRSYLALDMESGGVLQAVYEATRSTDGLIIRGISDFADERKKELDKVGKGELRRCAMHNALLFLWSLMKAGRMPHVESE